MSVPGNDSICEDTMNDWERLERRRIRIEIEEETEVHTDEQGED